MNHWASKHGVETVGFGKGGTVHLGDAAVTMVNAVHSSSLETENGPLYAGSEAGLMIAGEFGGAIPVPRWRNAYVPVSSEYLVGVHVDAEQ